jgi:hypothetical protein
MIESLFLSTPWPGVIVWCCLYISDWLFTTSCARLYQRSVASTIVFEGSLEITPFFQRDIDALRRWSGRFTMMLVLTVAMFWFMWTWWADSDPGLYLMILGCYISTELVVHVRHLRNLFLFRQVERRVVRGHIEYPRQMMLLGSSLELLTFAAVLLVLFAFTESPFVLGGAIGSASLSLQHWRLARNHLRTVAAEGTRAPSPVQPIG